MKVSVLAVVGAFRTGKSFVLDIFLRYLQYCEDHPEYDFGASPHTSSCSCAWTKPSSTQGVTNPKPATLRGSSPITQLADRYVWCAYAVSSRAYL